MRSDLYDPESLSFVFNTGSSVDILAKNLTGNGINKITAMNIIDTVAIIIPSNKAVFVTIKI